MTGGGAREDDTQNDGYDWRGNKPAIVALSFSHTETKDAEQFYNKKVRKRSKIKIMTLCIFVHIFNLCLVITFNHLLHLTSGGGFSGKHPTQNPFHLFGD